MLDTIVIHAADNNMGAGIAFLIASVFVEYENCPFMAGEFPEMAAISDHYRSRGGEIWVAQDRTMASDVILGCFAILPTLEPSLYEIGKVYVTREIRGRGVALQLYETAMKWAAHRGMKRVRLWSDTRFKAGHRFYEKLGFIRIPVVRHLADAAKSWEYLYISQPA